MSLRAPAALHLISFSLISQLLWSRLSFIRIVGEVVSGERSARIVETPRVMEVPSVERDDELW